MSMEIPIAQYIERIPVFQAGCEFHKITKGFSPDKKYRVRTPSGSQFLLRVVSADKMERTRTEYHLIQQLHRAQVMVPQPITYGYWEDLRVGFYVLSFIEGQDAEEALRHYSADTQWQVGVAAGRDLYRMHQLHAPPEVAPWYPRVLQKIRASVGAYRQLGMTIPGAGRIIDFIEQSEPYLRDRPSGFQHDDFHVANIIIAGDQYAGVIDFNRWDWGDPIHDFLKIAFFSWPTSVPFSIGQLQGYFGHKAISDELWHLYSLYVAVSLFASMVWTMRVAPERIEDMMVRIHRVLDDHRYFETLRPTWFTES